MAKKTIADFEREARTPYDRTLAAIRAALEAAGVEFIPENGGGPGVRLREATSLSGTTPPPSFSATIGAALDVMPGNTAGGPQRDATQPRTVHPEDEVRGGEEAPEE